MSPQDQYLQSQLPAILEPGEQVLHAAYMRRQPGLAMQLLLVGGLLLFLMTKAYFAVLTNRRLILIRTKMSFWSGGPKPMNLGVEQIDVRSIQKVTVSGFANNRSMTFHLDSGKKETLRISPWFKQIGGTKAFFEAVPQLVASGQLAALAGAAPPQLAGGSHAAPMQSAPAGYGAPPSGGYAQQGGYGAPPQANGGYPQQPPYGQPQGAQDPYAQQGYGAPQGAAYGGAPQPGYGAAPAPYGAPPPAGFPPGAPVQVSAPDGQRYPATVVQEQNGHVLCALANGQQHWFPSGALSRV